MITLYEILEVSEKASNEIIEKAYKTLAKKYHPDLQTNEENKKIASEKMKKINEAYSILSNSEKRKKYDIELVEKRKQIEEQQKNKQNMQNIQNNQNYSNNENYQNNLNYQNYRNYQIDQDKIRQQIQKEYETAYRKYLKGLGYKTRRKITAKSICSFFITVSILIVIGWILWKIPISHNYLDKIYRENEIVKILVDIIIGIIKGIIETLKNINKTKL